VNDAYRHEVDLDVPIGNAWVRRKHYEKHIEILGASGQGKTTLAEHLILGILERQDAGILHLDPTGDSYRKFVGWLAEGRLDRPAWLVDLDHAALRYNPLAAAKKDPGAFVDGLYSSLHLIQATDAGTQHRQMRRFVIATLRALIECDLTLADAYQWL
jgi:DNA helicase HerA-like ATPase